MIKSFQLSIWWPLVIIIGGGLPSSFSQDGVTGCMPGWTFSSSNNMCYQINNEDARPFDDAVQECINQDSTLADTNDGLLWKFIKEHRGNTNQSEDFWYWAHRDSSNNCRYVDKDYIRTVECSNLVSYICQQSALEDGCPVWSFPLNDKCYYRPKSKIVLSDRTAACRYGKTWSLASIHDSATFKSLEKRFETADEARLWVGLYKDKNQYKWVNGETVVFAPWVKSHTGKEGLKCVAAHFSTSVPTPLFSAVDCTAALNPLCERPRVMSSEKPQEPQIAWLDCDTHWEEYNNYCYGIILETRSWAGAQEVCRYHDAHLVSIHSQEESEFLGNTFNGYKNLDIWIGLSKVESSPFTWSDESPFDFSNWPDGDLNVNDKSCTKLSISDVKWNNLDCNGNLPFVCKKWKGVYLTTTASPTTEMETSATEPPTLTTQLIMTTTQLPTTIKETEITTTQLPTTTTEPKMTTTQPPTTIEEAEATRTQLPTTTTEPKTTTTHLPTTIREPKTTTTQLPTTITEPKMTTTQLPTTITEPKMTTTQLPTTITEPKMTTTQLPTTITEPKTTTTTQLPTTITEPKMTTAQLPTTIKEAEVATTQLPTTITEPKMTTTQLPATIKEAEVTTTQLPTTITEPKMTTTQLPKTIKEAEVTTTQLPTTITEPKITTTQLPTTIKEAEVPTTQLPTTIKEAEATTTKLPTTTTEPKMTTTQLPTTITDTKMTTTHLPATIKEAEVTTTQLPTTIKEAEVTTTQLPTTIKEAEVTTTQLPNTLTEPKITTTQLPTTIKEAEFPTTQLPTTIKEAEATTTKLPTTTTEPKMTTTQLPTTITEPKMTTTQLPTTIKEAEVTSTQLPTTITEPKMTKTQLPTTIKEIEATTAQLPTTTAEPKMTTTQLPTTITEPKMTTTQLPTTIKEAEVATTQLPTTIKEAEATTTKLPTTITEPKIATTQLPTAIKEHEMTTTHFPITTSQPEELTTTQSELIPTSIPPAATTQQQTQPPPTQTHTTANMFTPTTTTTTQLPLFQPGISGVAGSGTDDSKGGPGGKALDSARKRSGTSILGQNPDFKLDGSVGSSKTLQKPEAPTQLSDSEPRGNSGDKDGMSESNSRGNTGQSKPEPGTGSRAVFLGVIYGALGFIVLLALILFLAARRGHNHYHHHHWQSARAQLLKKKHGSSKNNYNNGRVQSYNHFQNAAYSSNLGIYDEVEIPTQGKPVGIAVRSSGRDGPILNEPVLVNALYTPEININDGVAMSSETNRSLSTFSVPPPDYYDTEKLMVDEDGLGTGKASRWSGRRKSSLHSDILTDREHLAAAVRNQARKNSNASSIYSIENREFGMKSEKNN